ncbi:Na/Pi cotransporter family protein [Brumimicrobium mesophilum]|uniref:Na/Pi cotransporter family protein n=1 Tax=Brumimicrobium mesophilum TaxID=392717 RepID=UPI000D1410C8|nr:Na/Pi cotransporter family protein [Brumimicrobium mesophilum]
MKNKLILSLAFLLGTFFTFHVNSQNDSISNATPKELSSDINSESIENISSTSSIEGFTALWNLDYEVFQDLKEAGYTVLLKYNTKIGEKRFEKGYSNSDWTVIEGIDLHETTYFIDSLDGEEDYVFKVGLTNGENTFWSGKYKAETERGWGIFRFLVLIGSLGMFIYGMKIMSEGLQQAAGSRLRYLLGSITSNRVKGVLTGFGITSIVQSSSVTTVMTVSFVNAGLMTLVQSAGVMMGANIGTTITGWIINIFGFKVSIGSYALVLIAIGAPLMFFGKQKLKAWSSAIIGFSLLFMGLGFLKDAVPELGPDSWLVQFFIDFKDIPFLSTILFVFLGTLVTLIVQSSSAAMALTMTLVAGGIIPFEVAAAMILGENIGTTITAELASTIGNVHAKRSARIHSLFNVIGVIWAILLFPFILQGIEYFMLSIGAGNPFDNPKEYANTGIAIFHTAFNLLNVMILIWFVPNLVKVAERTVKSKGGADEEFHLDYIGAGYMSTPDLSLLEAKKEIAKFGELTSRMSRFSQDLLFEKSRKKQKLLIDRIAKYEEITDRVEVEVANYLGKISEGELSVDTAIRIRGMNSIVNDLERIGDVFYQVSKSLERKSEDKIWFTPHQRERLAELFDLVDEAFVVMCENLKKHSADVTLDVANEVEKRINQKRDEIRSEYLDALSKDDEVHMKGGIIYNDIFASLEKVGDHIINVSEGIVGKV